MRLPAVVSRPAQPVVHAGRGAGAAVLAAADGPRTLVVLDAAVAARCAPLQRARVRHVAAPVGVDDVRALAGELAAHRVELVVAVGGGNTMDLATLAVAAVADPRLLDDVAGQSRRAGFVVPRPGPGAAQRPRLVVVPTTLGTGAEASSVACCQVVLDDGPAKALVSVPHVRADCVCYDPHLLAGPTWLVREGAFEAATRVLAAAAESGSTLWRAELDAHQVLTTLGALLDAVLRPGTPADDVLVALASLSADTHGGWALRGRGTAPSSLWFVATELSTVTGWRKARAMRVLLPAWLDELAAAGRDSAVDALCRDLGVPGGLAGVEPWAQALVPRPTGDGPGPLAGPVLDALVSRVLRRFGHGRPMRREVGADVLRRVLVAALGSPAGLDGSVTAVPAGGGAR